MENAYQPEAWHNLYVMLGGSTAALTGLLFVATSLHLDDIMKVPLLRIFARNNTIAMMDLVIRAAVILVPQNPILLAGELIVINIFGVVMVLNVLIRHDRKTPWGRQLRAGAVGLSCLLGMVGALSLLIQSGGGMYVITAAYLIFLCLTVSSAWVLMVGVYQPDHASELL